MNQFIEIKLSPNQELILNPERAQSAAFEINAAFNESISEISLFTSLYSRPSSLLNQQEDEDNLHGMLQNFYLV
jgi:hypothetical protein